MSFKKIAINFFFRDCRAAEMWFSLHRDCRAAEMWFYLHRDCRAAEKRFSLHRDALLKEIVNIMRDILKNFPRCARLPFLRIKKEKGMMYWKIVAALRALVSGSLPHGPTLTHLHMSSRLTFRKDDNLAILESTAKTCTGVRKGALH